MKDYQKTLLLGILITILLYLHYHKNIEQELFTNQINNIPNCYNPKFTMETNNNIIKHCADIKGISNGCHDTDLNKKRNPKLSAFSIFG